MEWMDGLHLVSHKSWLFVSQPLRVFVQLSKRTISAFLQLGPFVSPVTLMDCCGCVRGVELGLRSTDRAVEGRSHDHGFVCGHYAAQSLLGRVNVINLGAAPKWLSTHGVSKFSARRRCDHPNIFNGRKKTGQQNQNVKYLEVTVSFFRFRLNCVIAQNTSTRRTQCGFNN